MLADTSVIQLEVLDAQHRVVEGELDDVLGFPIRIRRDDAENARSLRIVEYDRLYRKSDVKEL